ncbi:MAG TPA: carboxypeptidase-like regulatory domain-containing protein [Pyrinomonadaceae bacterium]|nr:carboxypeptidase-like regulatory domain-containing protein [Pyrinomonadaceae bacterium]
MNYGVTHFINQNSTSSWSNGAVSNARGEFKLDGLIPGQYAITVRPTAENDWRGDQVRFEIVDQDVTDLVIKGRQGSSLSGVVILEGVDDKAVRDQLYQTGLTASVVGDANERPWSNWSVVKPDGSFRIGGLQAGLASFFFPNSSRFRMARVEHNGVILPKGIEIKDGQHLTGLRVIVNYANASLRGVITLENGPMPENGRYYAQIRRAGDESRYVSGEPAQVDSRGLFLIENLTPGAYMLSVGVYVPGPTPIMVDTKQDVVVTGGVTTNVNVTLDLKKASKLRP